MRGGGWMMRDVQKPVNKGSIWNMYKHMFSHVRKHWKIMFVACFSIIAISSLQFVIPQLSQYTIDVVIGEKLYGQLLWVAAGILGAAALLGGFHFLSSYMMAQVGQRSVYELRNDLYQHISNLDMKFFDRTRTGDLMSRVTNDVNMLQQLVSSGMMQIVTELVTFIAISAFMLYTNWQLTLLLMITFPLMFLTTKFFSKRMRAKFKVVQQSVAEVSNHLQDTLSGIRLIKTFSSEDYENGRFSEKSQSNMMANLDAAKLRATYEPIIDFLNYLGMAIVLVFGAWQVMQNELTVGAIVAYLAYLRLLQGPVRQISRTLNMIQQSAAAYERIVEILETKPNVTEKPDAVPLPPIQGHIVFSGVNFAYQPNKPVLRDFDLDIAPGKVTALVGSSGAGKSTIAHLIARFYDPQEGTITIDGHPLTDVTIKSLRTQMGIVSQDIILLNGTVRENIMYGKPDATEEEVIEAAKAANAHEFIMSFPDGYESQIGERGVKLSGGQKQRLSIARAILKDPRLVILDEATAALDTESEQLIQEALGRLLVGRTCIVIAHRLSTIQKADRIIVLEKGQVAESGTHDELLALGGRYKYLYDLQFPQSDENSEPELEPVPVRGRGERRFPGHRPGFHPGM
jgi:subfamily B ATP-binding cassette protein MsbA